jgi:hypothetical protein
MKNLPIGRQNFEDIIKENLLYVDKTKQVYDIIQKGNLFFLSRPRRFGKSLLISLFKHLFEGKKEVFKDLHIGKSTDYEFETYPVLQFNFAKLGHKVENLEAELINQVENHATTFGVETTKISLTTRFYSLIQEISKRGKPVVILIDEYDKPIIDFFTEPKKAAVNRNVLRDLFAPLKDLDANGHLRFLFITGVSKFSKVSLFSDLNNLKDLSQSNWANDLLGITQTELERDFSEHIEFAAHSLEIDKSKLLSTMKDWYNGYSYDGKTTVYNPFSILNFFGENSFENYWFVTGTPTFLVETIRNEGINPKVLENIEVDAFFFDSFSIEHLDMIGLLYQTGYLTIKKIISKNFRKRYFLGYPNLEVRHSMLHNLVQAFTYQPKSTVSSAMVRMQNGMEEGDVGLFVEQLKVILSDISYHLQPKKQKTEETLFKMWEGYFQTIIYLITSYMELSVQTEVTKHKGRLDLIAESEDFIYLMEFKLDGSSTDAIEQIKDQDYAAAYRNSPKKVFLVGVNFSKEERNVESWECVVWER